MSITITLPAETEDRLRAHAEATGKNLSTVVLEAVEARLALSELCLRQILAPVHADLHRSGMNEAELDTLLQESLNAARLERKASPDPPA